MAQFDLDVETKTEVGYGHLLSILWRRRFWFSGIFASVFVLGLLIALSKESIYKSYMQLLIEPNYTDKQEEDRFTGSNVQLDYATQLNLMRSSLLIQRAIDTLKPEYPELTIKELRKDLALEQLKNEDDKEKVETKIFQAVYTANDPVKTQKVLQAIQKVYQQYNLEQQDQRLKDGLSFINKQMPVARQSVIQAETELKNFRQKNNLIAPEKEATEVAEDLRDIEKDRELLQTQYKENKARYGDLQRQLSRTPQGAMVANRLSESSRYQKLLDELQKTELALSAERTVSTEANPVLQNLVEKRDSQRQLLQQEVEKILGSNSTHTKVPEESLQSEGELGPSDVNLSRALLEAQTNIAVLQERDRGLRNTEKRLRDRINNFPKLIDEYNSLQQEVEVKRGTLQQLLEARQRLGIEINRGGFNWQVVEPPQTGLKIGPKTTQNILLSGIAGLFIGGVAAFVRETIDDSLRSAQQIKEQVAFPVLGEVPQLNCAKLGKFFVQLPWRNVSQSETSIFQLIQWQAFRDSLDLLYMNIQLLNSAANLKSLVVTSAISSEGKSTLILGLALSAARLQKRVLLIDTDLRKPSLHVKLNLPNERGLVDLLAGKTQVPDLHSVALLDSQIDILTAGSIPVDPVQLLSKNRLGKLVKAFEQRYDLVLLDTSPMLGMVDAIQAASCCDGVLMVARIDRVTRSQMAEATALLSKLNLIGIVANSDKETDYKYLKYGGYYNQNNALNPADKAS